MEATLKRRSEDQILNRMISLWPLIAAIVGGVASMSIIKYQVNNPEGRIMKVEKDVEELKAIKSNVDLLVDVLVRRRESRSERRPQ